MEVENPELAARFRALPESEQRGLASRMVQRALDAQEPPLKAPSDPRELARVARELDASEDEPDFPRARAAMAARFLQQRDPGALEEALYEALHARESISAAVDEALALIPGQAPSN